jgi:2-polyprenyl-6-methoxyphenol hydroxylase-like FAD-dependent oxidoreductase
VTPVRPAAAASSGDPYDVAIVGYGPTGMTLAALLGGLGHRVVVLERYQGLYNLPRAACFDDEIMRTFQKLGLADEVLPGSVVQTDYEWVNGAGQTLLEVHYDNPARGGWAALYMMYQPYIEAVLDRRCKSLPTVEVRQGWTVDAVQTAGEGVTLEATGQHGDRQTVRARFAVAADGGTGFIRNSLGIGISDYNFQENWLVCDFRKRHELPGVPTFRQVCDPVQPTSIVRIGPHHQRFSFMLEPDEHPGRATDPGRVWQRVAPYLGPDDAELVRVANYVFRSRIADQWRKGPVLLAGDAAHEMPPFLAQGMCSGMRDSHNLAWKLDLVLSGLSGPHILDTYQAEREPHVRFITEKAIELGRVQTLRDPVAAHARDERLLAQRRDRREPERLVYPDLGAGLIAAGAPLAGAVFPQACVTDDHGRRRLFDDVAGPGPVLVTRRAELLAAADPALTQRWKRLGGRTVLIQPSHRVPEQNHDGTLTVTDIDGAYAAWFDQHGCESALVRPDWYLFGAAAGDTDIWWLVDQMIRAVA